MTKAKVFFEFDGYVLRSAEESDLDLATQWTTADAHHAGKFPATFWTQENDPSADTYVLEDALGRVAFVRLERVTRVLMQMPPMTGDSQMRGRVRQALRDGVKWLVSALGVNRQRELIFDTQADWLRHFAGKTLGFRDYPGVLRQGVPVYTPPDSDIQERPVTAPRSGYESDIQPRESDDPIPGIKAKE